VRALIVEDGNQRGVLAASGDGDGNPWWWRSARRVRRP
jgi:hypothetical protein